MLHHGVTSVTYVTKAFRPVTCVTVPPPPTPCIAESRLSEKYKNHVLLIGIQMEVDMDDEGVIIESPAKCEAAQLCESLISLAAQVDVTRDPEARAFLLQTMSAVSYALNPPKGEVREFRSKK